MNRCLAIDYVSGEREQTDGAVTTANDAPPCEPEPAVA